jgi:hypothetical protein
METLEQLVDCRTRLMLKLGGEEQKKGETSFFVCFFY